MVEDLANLVTLASPVTLVHLVLYNLNTSEIYWKNTLENMNHICFIFQKVCLDIVVLMESLVIEVMMDSWDDQD